MPHARAAAYACEMLEPRCLFDALTLIPEIQSAMDNPRQRTPGRGVAISAPQITPPEDAPALAGTQEAVNFDSDASTTGFYHIPPDTHGAAGPNHIVNVINTTIQWFNKTGTLQNTQRLGNNGSAVGSFFAARSPVNGLFDPRAMYDQYNNRFVVVAAEYRDTALGDPVNSSRILVAVSDDSDPNGTWYSMAINSNVVISATNTWADFPQTGVDSNAIYITGNMFSYGSGSYFGSRLWIIPKTGFYTGGAATSNIYDPATSTGLGGAFSLQPTHMYGTTPGSTGTFLVSNSFISGSNELLSVIRVDNPVGATSFAAQNINLGDIDNQANVFNIPQSGTATTIRAGDRRVHDAVWRNNSLYTVNTTSPTSGVDINTSTVRWYRVNTTTLGSLSLADTGLVSGEDIAAATRTFYPSISVDQNNNVGIAFSASGPSIFPGSYYTGRLSGDAAGTVQSSGVIAAGQAFYIRTFNGSGSAGNRWGDYSAISLDPSDGTTFWAYNMYALTQGTTFSGESGRWGTRWGKFAFAAVPPAPSTPDLATSSDSGTSNTDNVTNDNTPTFTGTAQVGSTVTIFVNGVNAGSGVAAGGAYSITTGVLADGVKTVNATAANGAGPGPLSGSLAVTIDTVAPAAPSTPDLAAASDSGGSNTDNVTNIVTPTLTGTAEANSLVQLLVDGIPNNTGAAAAGAYSIATTALAGGTRLISARATDVAGNVGGPSSSLSVSIDITAPSASPASFNYLTAGTTFTIPFNENVNLPALTTTDFTVQNLTTLAFIPSGSMTISYNAGPNVATIGFSGGIIPNGIYQINVVPAGVTDVAGNQVVGTLSTGPNFFQQADANRDRAVNTLDFNILAANFGAPGNWAQGNFNYAGNIDSLDFSIFVSEYGKKLPATPGPLPGSPFSGDPIASDDGWQDFI